MNARFWGNLVGYQAVWFCMVLGAGRGLWWPGTLAAALFVGWQMLLSDARSRDARLLVVAIACGAVIETALAATGWMRYGAPWPSAAFAPVWILALWCAFAMTVGVSLALLQKSLVVAALFGAIGGPLAYLGAERAFAAVQFAAPTQALLALGLGWAIAMPLLAAIARRHGAPKATSMRAEAAR